MKTDLNLNWEKDLYLSRWLKNKKGKKVKHRATTLEFWCWDEYSVYPSCKPAHPSPTRIFSVLPVTIELDRKRRTDTLVLETIYIQQESAGGDYERGEVDTNNIKKGGDDTVLLRQA